MAAVVTAHVYTGASAGTESSAQTGISFLAIDSAATDATTRQNNPVAAGTNSYEKHMRFKIATSPAVGCSNWRIWTATSQVTNVDLRAKGSLGTGGASPGTGDTAPVNTAMTGDVSLYSYTAQGTSYQVDSASYITVGNVTKAFALQLQPQAAAAPGVWTQHTIGYSYDEV